MARIGSVKADMEKVENGEWVKWSAGIELLIASINSEAYRTARAKILKLHARDRLTGVLSPDDIIELIKPAIAKHILLGWSNIEDDGGTTIVYSAAKATEFFNDPALRDLYDFVLAVAGESEVFRVKAVEDEAGNLETA